jgi:hypothetical protein
MKKLLFLAVLLVGISVYSQKAKADVFIEKHMTSTERDALTVPSGETWHIYNSTTAQNEKNIAGAGWVADGSGADGLGSARDVGPFTVVDADNATMNEASITSSHITNEAIVTQDLADAAITTNKLAESAVDESKLKAANSPTDTYLLQYDSGGGSFDIKWVDPATVGAGGDLSAADIDTYSELNTIVADQTLTHNGLIDTSAEIAAIVGDETGSGALVFATSPTLVTPALGTPASGVMTNVTGLPTTGLVADAITEAKIADNAVQEEHLKAVNSPTDEYFLTYEATTGDFEWQSSAASLPVGDGTSIVEGSSDATKELRLEVDGLTTATTRVWTVPDEDIDIGLLVESDVTGVTGADKIENTMSLTQSEYDAITPDANTLYIITDAKQELSVTIPLTAIGGDVATGTDLNFWEVHDAITLTRVAGFVLTAGTTSTITIDIHEDGTTVMSTDKIEIEAGDKWSEDATDQPVISDTAINAQSILTFDIDGADSGDTGTDPSVTIWYTVD